MTLNISLTDTLHSDPHNRLKHNLNSETFDCNFFVLKCPYLVQLFSTKLNSKWNVGRSQTSPAGLFKILNKYWKLEDDILTEVTLACEDNIKFKAHFKVYVKDKTKTNNNEIMLNEDERDTIIE